MAADPSNELGKGTEVDLALFYPLFASSSWSADWGPQQARFDARPHHNGSSTWVCNTLSVMEFLGVSFCGQVATVTGVSTRGRDETYHQYIEKYQIEATLDGVTWEIVDAKTFDGNTDDQTIVRQNFKKPVLARAIRIRPQVWHGHISTKLAVHGFFPL